MTLQINTNTQKTERKEGLYHFRLKLLQVSHRHRPFFVQWQYLVHFLVQRHFSPSSPPIVTRTTFSPFQAPPTLFGNHLPCPLLPLLLHLPHRLPHLLLRHLKTRRFWRMILYRIQRLQRRQLQGLVWGLVLVGGGVRGVPKEGSLAGAPPRTWEFFWATWKSALP